MPFNCHLIRIVCRKTAEKWDLIREKVVTEAIFWSIYVANLPDKIHWFFTQAPIRKWYKFFASVHRMTWNATLLNFNHP
jgi:hypothetical protein